MTPTDLAVAIAKTMSWSPHDDSDSVRLASALLEKYDISPKETIPTQD